MSGNQTTKRIVNQLMPKGNIAKTLPYVAQTVSGGPDLLDLTYAITNNIIDQIQSVFIDNSKGSATFVLTIQSTGMQVKCPPASQGWFPLFVSHPNGGEFSFTGANHTTPVFFANIPMPVGVWSVNAINLSGGGVGTGPIVFTIATGGTAVEVWNPAPSDGAVIVNPLNATESLFVDIVNLPTVAAPGTNGTTVELKAGGAFIVPANFTGIVYAVAATTGHVFSAYGVG
jgi:hypothetical protein